MLKPAFLTALVASMTLAFASSTWAQSRLLIQRDITYTNAPTKNGSIALKFDLAQPMDACTNLRPTVVLIHGGGFTGGSREGPLARFGPTLAGKGWNAVSLSYRLVRDAPVIAPSLEQSIPTHGKKRKQAVAALGAVETTIAALDYLRGQAHALCVDPDRIALLGSSAGGLTVLNSAYAADELGLAAPNLVGVVNFWGNLIDTSFLGPNDVPLLIFHGDRDRTIPITDSRALYARGEATGTSVQLHELRGKGHGFKEISPEYERINGHRLMDVMTDWLAQIFAGQRPATLHTRS